MVSKTKNGIEQIANNINLFKPNNIILFMNKTLSQKTAYTPWLMLEIAKAAVNLDRRTQDIQTEITNAENIVELLKETYQDSIKKESLIETDFSSVWNSALTTRLIPKVYGIEKTMPYRKEHFEAGLYFILEQLEDLKNADKVRTEFARSVFVKLGNSLISEANVWWRNPNRRRYAA